MLHAFYGKFAPALEKAHATLKHAKAETQPAPYRCPTCESRTVYRFGKNGRFLSCGSYPDCDYAAPINREGHPMLPEHVDVICPEDGSAMVLGTGRFGKFLASVNYPDTKFVINLDKKERLKYPAIPPVLTELECEKCGSALNLRRGKRGPWLGCSTFPKCRGRLSFAKLEEDQKRQLTAELEEHEKEHPQPIIRNREGRIIPEETPIEELLIPGGEAKLDLFEPAVPSARSA